MGGFMTLIALAFLAFLVFTIYFFFKSMQFVIQAVDLYKKMINREEAILQVLVDIRDNTKSYEGNSGPTGTPSLQEVLKMRDAQKGAQAQAPAIPTIAPTAAQILACKACNTELKAGDEFCPQCGKPTIS